MRSRSLLYIVFCLLFLTACYNRGQQSADAWDLTEHQLDSISFSTTHHYTQNYNFMVTANRLPLADALPDMAFDTLYVVRGDRVVVADIQKVPADTIDSVWVKVAHDQITQGWIRESELLQGVSPDDPISQFIDVFSNTHLLVFMAICVLVGSAYAMRKLLRRRAYIVHFHDIDSAYPAMLCVLIAMSATLYASIQMFGAESWRHYYFHPSLNPFALPLHLGLFVASVWAIIIMAVAVLDDVRHQSYCRLCRHLRGVHHLHALLRRLSPPGGLHRLCRVVLPAPSPLSLPLRTVWWQDEEERHLSPLRSSQCVTQKGLRKQ